MMIRKIFLLAGLVWLTACGGDSPEEPEPAAATITLTSPAEGDMFLANQTVRIKGTITAAQDLHGYQVTLRNKANNTVAYTVDGHAHGKSITFDELWVNNVPSDAVLEVEVSAVVDHEGHKAVKKVTIHCHS